MKYLLILFACISFSAFSQDVILKKDGSKIEAKVLEITPTSIKYRSWNQQDGPLRSIEIKDVKEVIYNDGTWESFENKEVKEEPKEEEAPKTDTHRPRTPPHPKLNTEGDPITKNGFFLEALPGVGIRSSTEMQTIYVYDPTLGYNVTQQQLQKRTDIYPTLSIRLGAKWYFGQREKWKPGIQLTALRFGLHIDPSDFPASIFYAPKNFSLGNVGMANVFKFNDNIGLEANVTTGYNLELDLYNLEMVSGISATGEVKFRYRKMAFGIDYMHIFGIDGVKYPPNWNMFSLSIGAKF